MLKLDKKLLQAGVFFNRKKHKGQMMSSPCVPACKKKKKNAEGGNFKQKNNFFLDSDLLMGKKTF